MGMTNPALVRRMNERKIEPEPERIRPYPPAHGSTFWEYHNCHRCKDGTAPERCHERSGCGEPHAKND